MVVFKAARQGGLEKMKFSLWIYLLFLSIFLSIWFICAELGTLKIKERQLEILASEERVQEIIFNNKEYARILTSFKLIPENKKWGKNK